ncbi:hypothetical protein BU100_13440 [Staphylococcus xylosus]|uniref:hypothetical protein n=1 Tax=Staphylococcus xylosus TaxID=1288 RepID=UPI000D1D309A|nr:hypothetical protein [Staphylococcus xylosus]MCE7784412.1 hypothetical protein [Staphylococcus xylosus]PTH96527.1 hypothetical protein BU105_11955 [Staphylococcus xylosus]RIM90882.1 hypothetical protein BU100_13440 [Staphylococcus xylosus]HCY0818136.1 hypothetical protein [Staphylococcus aureus]
MFKLSQIELITMISRKSIFFLLFIFLLFLSFNIYDSYKDNEHNNDWKSKVQNDIKLQKQEMSNENNTNEIKNYFATNIKKNAMYLNHNINPYEKNQYTFIQKNLNFLAIIPIFILFMSSFIVFKEYKYNFIKNIKLSTTTSFQSIVSKFITMVIILSIIFFCTYIFTFFTGGIVNKFTDFNYEMVTQSQNNLELKNAFAYISKIFLADYLTSILLIAFIFMMISLTKSSSLSLLLSILLLISHKNISAQLSFLPWTKYLFFNTLNIRDLINKSHSFDFNADIIVFSILNVFYIILFLTISIYFFKKIKI